MTDKINKASKVLFICMGNICRSPSAQGVFEAIVMSKGVVEQFQIDSAGTHAYHVGHQPDPRSMQAANNRGMDLSHQRARKISAKDFESFDCIVAMDDENFDNLIQMSEAKYHPKIHKMVSFSVCSNANEVPDPYYGGEQGFEEVLDLLESACDGLFQFLQAVSN